TVGIFFLRLFPIALRGGAWVVAKTQATAVLFWTWQLVRNPVHYSRVVLLLMLATAVGMFAASFRAALARSYYDRASYQSGAPFRIESMRRVEASSPGTLGPALGNRYDARDLMPVVRLDGSQGTGFQRNNFSILGVDPQQYSDVGYFRDDFADSS